MKREKQSWHLTFLSNKTTKSVFKKSIAILLVFIMAINSTGAIAVQNFDGELNVGATTLGNIALTFNPINFPSYLNLSEIGKNVTVNVQVTAIYNGATITPPSYLPDDEDLKEDEDTTYEKEDEDYINEEDNDNVADENDESSDENLLDEDEATEDEALGDNYDVNNEDESKEDTYNNEGNEDEVENNTSNDESNEDVTEESTADEENTYNANNESANEEATNETEVDNTSPEISTETSTSNETVAFFTSFFGSLITFVPFSVLRAYADEVDVTQGNESSSNNYYTTSMLNFYWYQNGERRSDKGVTNLNVINQFGYTSTADISLNFNETTVEDFGTWSLRAYDGTNFVQSPYKLSLTLVNQDEVVDLPLAINFLNYELNLQVTHETTEEEILTTLLEDVYVVRTTDEEESYTILPYQNINLSVSDNGGLLDWVKVIQGNTILTEEEAYDFFYALVFNDDDMLVFNVTYEALYTSNVGYEEYEKEEVSRSRDITVSPLLFEALNSITVTTWQQLQQAVNTAGGAGARTIVIANDITMLGQLSLPLSSNITLVTDGQPRILSTNVGNGQFHFLLDGGGRTLTINDTNLTIQGRLGLGVANGNRGGGIRALSGSVVNLNQGVMRQIYNSGTGNAAISMGNFGNAVNNTPANVHIRDGFIIENNRSSSGGAINVGHGNPGGNGSHLQIHGGIIRNNHSTSNGGAIWTQWTGRVTINGGEFYNNTAQTNGGFITSAGSGPLIISGGYFHNNRALTGFGGVISNSSHSSPLTITDGRFYRNIAATDGGVIRSGSSGATNISGGSFRYNQAQRAGAIMHAGNPNFNLTNAIFYDNRATATHGGAIHLQSNSNATIGNGVQVTNNTAQGNGGGISLATDTRLTITGNANVSNNRAVHGGGIHASGSNTSTVTINNANVIIQNNEVTGNGGGISLAGDTLLTLSNGIVENNRATNGAGINTAANARVNITGGQVRDNVATGNGGGINTSGDTQLSIGNATIANNRAANGGGISLSGTTQTTISSGSIRDNEATNNGGGINLATGDNALSRALNITGGVIANNRAVNGGAISRTVHANMNSRALNISNVTLENNVATEAGGAIFLGNHNGIAGPSRDALNIAATTIFRANRSDREENDINILVSRLTSGTLAVRELHERIHWQGANSRGGFRANPNDISLFNNDDISMYLPAIIVEYINANTSVNLVRLPQGTYTIDPQSGVVTVYPGGDISFSELFILMPPGWFFTYNPNPNTPLWVRIQPPWLETDWEGYIGNHPNRPGWSMDPYKPGRIVVGPGTINNPLYVDANSNKTSWSELAHGNVHVDIISFTGDIVGGQDMSYLFANFVDLIRIDNLNRFNTSQTRYMQYMFANVRKLPTVNIGTFNTGNVINMQGMFYNAEMLTSLGLSSFNTSNVVNMRAMFYGTNLVVLNISSFDTRNVVDMRQMLNLPTLRTLAIGNNTTFTAYQGGGANLPNIISNASVPNHYWWVHQGSATVRNIKTSEQVMNNDAFMGTWVLGPAFSPPDYPFVNVGPDGEVTTNIPGAEVEEDDGNRNIIVTIPPYVLPPGLSPDVNLPGPDWSYNVNTDNDGNTVITVVRPPFVDVGPDGEITTNIPDVDVGTDGDDNIVITIPPSTLPPGVSPDVNLPGPEWGYEVDTDGDGNTVITITPPSHTLTINNPYAVGGTATGNQARPVAANVTVEAGTRDGFTLISWTLQGNVPSLSPSALGQYNLNFRMPPNNVALTANWGAVPQTLTINNPYAIGATQSGERLTATTVTVNAGTRVGMYVTHWSVYPASFASEITPYIGNANVTTLTFTMPPHGVELTPNWSYVPLTLSVIDGNITYPSNIPTHFYYGDTITLEEDVESGVDFTRWEFRNSNGVIINPSNLITSGSITSSPITFTMPSHNLTVRAVGEAGVRLLFGGVGASHNATNTYYEVGDLVVIDVGTRENLALSNITVHPSSFTNDVNYSSRFVIFTMPSHGVTITANWEEEAEEVLLLFSAQGPGSIEATNGSTLSSPAIVNIGETIQFLATNGTNARLLSWQVNGVTQVTNSYTFNLSVVQSLVQQNNTIEVIAIFESTDTGGSGSNGGNGNNGGNNNGGNGTSGGNNVTPPITGPAVPPPIPPGEVPPPSVVTPDPTPPTEVPQNGDNGNNILPDIAPPSGGDSNDIPSSGDNSDNLLPNVMPPSDGDVILNETQPNNNEDNNVLLSIPEFSVDDSDGETQLPADDNNENGDNGSAIVPNTLGMGANGGLGTQEDSSSVSDVEQPTQNQLLQILADLGVPLGIINVLERLNNGPLIIPLLVSLGALVILLLLFGKRRTINVIDLQNSSNSFSFKLVRNKKLIIPPKFIKDGYVIQSLFLNESMTKDEEVTLGDYVPKGNTTLYVKWESSTQDTLEVATSNEESYSTGGGK